MSWLKLTSQNKVTLPNGRIFYAKYKRVKRSLLPDNVTKKRTYKKRRRKKQQGEGLGSILKTVFACLKVKSEEI